jgi:hypothetical protein
VAGSLRHGALPTAVARLRSARFVVALLGIAALGAVCEPGAIRVVNRPPDPILVDADGEVEQRGVDELIAAVERERGLRFIQHPTLELLAPDDARLPSLRAAARAREACPRAEAVAMEAGGRCFPDPSLEWIDCMVPPDLEEARRALRRLLDAQNYPRLARLAPATSGDPGVALRAVLAASANGAPASAAPFDEGDPVELFELPVIDVDRRDAASEGCGAIAAHFLSLQRDREAPFRNPPLSTKQLVSPKRYRAGERPVLLIGSPLEVAGCRVESDASVGVARLLVELLAKGGSLPGPLLAGWEGDRGVRYACDDGRAPWVYVAELSDPERAAAFAQAIGGLLPGEYADPSASRAVGRRVVATSAGIGPQRAIAWATALAIGQLAGFRGPD